MPFVAEQFYKLVGVVRMNGNDGLRLKLAEYLTQAFHIAMSAGSRYSYLLPNAFANSLL